MPPSKESSSFIFTNIDTPDDDAIVIKPNQNDYKENEDKEYKPKIKWPDLGVQIFIHAGCAYGFYLMFIKANLLTSLWGKFIHYY